LWFKVNFYKVKGLMILISQFRRASP